MLRQLLLLSVPATAIAGGMLSVTPAVAPAENETAQRTAEIDAIDLAVAGLPESSPLDEQMLVAGGYGHGWGHGHGHGHGWGHGRGYGWGGGYGRGYGWGYGGYGRGYGGHGHGWGHGHGGGHGHGHGHGGGHGHHN